MTSYAETYSNWVNGLPQSKREKLAKAGLDKPLIDYQTNTPDDTVIFAKMGVEFDYDALDAECDVDSIAEIVEERAKPMERSCFRGYLPDCRPTRARGVPVSTATRSYLRSVWRASKAERKLP